MGFIHGHERTAHEIEMDNREAEGLAEMFRTPAGPPQPEPEPCEVCGERLVLHEWAIYTVYENLTKEIERLRARIERLEKRR